MRETGPADGLELWKGDRKESHSPVIDVQSQSRATADNNNG